MPPELLPNPEGCPGFAPNAFKRQKCKNCGRLWTEHRGVISEALVHELWQAQEQGSRQKAAQAKQKAQPKKRPPKPAAVEDEWLFGGGAEDGKNSGEVSDDDLGFQMISPRGAATLALAQQQRAGQPGPAGADKPLKVKNLIDFGECDVAEDSPIGGGGDGDWGGRPRRPSTVSSQRCSVREDVALHAAHPALVAVPAVEDLGCGPEEMIAEIGHLRQMLESARQEKDIEIAIVRDEIAEKNKVIESLEAAAQSSAKEGQEDDGSKTQELQVLRSEVEGLREAARRVAEELEGAQLAVAAAEERASAARSQAEEASLRAELFAGQQQGFSEMPILACGAGGGVPVCNAEAVAVAENLGRQAQEVFREIRQSADTHIAWLRKLLAQTGSSSEGDVAQPA